MEIQNPLRKTKIIATIGPACDSLETLEAMMRAGMSVARLNLSHGSYNEHRERLKRIRLTAEKLCINVATMIDTRGIEIRTGRIEEGWIDLTVGDRFTLFTDGRLGNQEGVSITYKKLPLEIGAGTPILLDDGNIELTAEQVDEEEIHCRVVLGGRLGDTKSVNLPETELSLRAVSPENRDDVIREMTFAAENEVDYIAASFVQHEEDVNLLREVLADHGVKIPIIAKIENRAGVKNLEGIVAAADGVMVARGDLGVELPLADVPGTQKKIIHMTVGQGKPVITATEMLASMQRNPKPTRAEASDVANAILDGTSAIMLSGETAAGKYPVLAVRTMAEIALRAESYLKEYGYLQRVAGNRSNIVTEAVSLASATMAEELNARAIFSLTETGFTSRMVSRRRPDCPILAITSSRIVARRLSLNWGVFPICFEGEINDQAKLDYGLERARELGYVGAGDLIIATAGSGQKKGGTDSIRVLTLE
ncbi:MAG: pyruvate kinase [gamma proteobacterium endosymbiont of Lamellibrachia anaximandri]|nr:pyruvate kinase [gamma proteobacterium endosymbiont of Lamellibrachia anaximandri]